ncbi:uncharacterized protein LOC108866787 [Pyrus x bretschneideri]|uniref:uncharacterized protein LOC108866787 n=1 Tax=Pyrus x bretschneideri TaxID=225117 RepID=UPI00202E3D5B|nr:uncharacterized protein LOC108866787 [Pyrus x bretschneideri]
MIRHTQKEELSPFHVFLTDCSRLSTLKHLRSHTWNNDGFFLRSGRHTYRGNFEMFRLGWRRGLMEEMLGPVTGIQDLEQRWLTMPESKPSVKFTLKMTGEGGA